MSFFMGDTFRGRALALLLVGLPTCVQSVPQSVIGKDEPTCLRCAAGFAMSGGGVGQAVTSSKSVGRSASNSAWRKLAAATFQ